MMKPNTEKKARGSLVRTNIKLARLRWRDQLSPVRLPELKKLSCRFGLSIDSGELLLVDGNWYVTSVGLLRIAARRRCLGIRTVMQERLCDPVANRWVFKATVYTSPNSKGFVGYGDADPCNVSSLVHGAEMRVAETRAVNRALRKAYGIGLCSVEELGWTPRRLEPELPKPNAAPAGNAHANGQPRLRDRLCLLIRQHHLDAGLVKAYAADYCGTPTLHLASRESVEAFINHLAERAANNREALLCHLNSYAKAPEAQP